MLEAAQEWGLTPSQFWGCSEEDQAFMIAFTRTVGQMRAYEQARAAPPSPQGEG